MYGEYMNDLNSYSWTEIYYTFKKPASNYFIELLHLEVFNFFFFILGVVKAKVLAYGR